MNEYELDRIVGAIEKVSSNPLLEIIKKLIDHFDLCQLSLFDCKTCQQYDAIMNIVAEVANTGK